MTEPAITLSPTRPIVVTCTCGCAFTVDCVEVAAVCAEGHAAGCPQWVEWAHERVDDALARLHQPGADHLGVLDVGMILHQLVDLPAALAEILPWLASLDAEADR